MLVLDKEVVLDEESHWWNTLAYDQYKIASYREYQYSAYWDKDYSLKLARRHIETNEVQTVIFPDKLSSQSNTHLNVVVGISHNDGRVHIAYNHHNTTTINYRVSDEGFATNPPNEIAMAHFSDNTNILEERTITYPRFFNDQNGELLLMFRQGGSGGGHKYLYDFDSSNNSWSKTGLVFSGDGNWNGSTSRNAYLQDLVFDKNNRLHATWVYRENAYSHSTNHGLFYAYSDDKGVTWCNNSDQQVANLNNNDPIRVDDSGIKVIDIPQNSWVLNQAAMTLDSNNQPHLLMSRSKDITTSVPETNVHYIHYWRTSDGNWHENYIVDTKNAVGHGAHWTEIFNYRGDIAIDEDDNIFVTLPMPNKTLYAAQAASGDWENWTTYALTMAEVSYPEQKYDRYRWKKEQVLSVPYTIEKYGNVQYVVRDYTFKEPHAPETPEL
ncbi:BNR repeat-containing protein [Alkalihalobacillus sp. 1P02AB]|uniref:BNR repeat-containing protein n=1 Tax=Alkalihalobacillus sp. 1P02AB TaxID=3132260 RepID=UPI0039A4DBC0